MSPFSHYCLWF